MGGFSLLFIVGAALSSCGDSEKLKEKEREIEELRQLAELDRREMENEYAEFAAQFGEMKKTIRDEKLLEQLDAEQKKAEKLAEELKNLKASNSAEILRLKKELQTVREVLRSYIRQVDSLQQINQALIGERDAALKEVERTKQENTSISEQNASLSEQVAIAAQLNATGIQINALNNRGKSARKSKQIEKFQVTFSIARNVTAQAGNRTVYLRLMKPNNSLLCPSGSFAYENKNIQYSAAKKIEYSGQEQQVTLFVPVDEYVGPGKYSAHIFVDGQMIGSGSLNIEK
jgi:myosin heavy subunit